MVPLERPRRNTTPRQQVAVITPVVNSATNTGFTPQIQQQNQRPRQQAQQFNNNQNRAPRVLQFNPVPMTYTKLYPALIKRNLIQTRAPPPIPDKLHLWYKADVSCHFHQGAHGHDLKHCIALKSEVQILVRAKYLSFKNENPNVQVNPLPNHGKNIVNMVNGVLVITKIGIYIW